jgi:hypothetical protein
VVDGTGSGLFPMVAFGINGIEPSGSVTTVLVTGNYDLHFHQQQVYAFLTSGFI